LQFGVHKLIIDGANKDDGIRIPHPNHHCYSPARGAVSTRTHLDGGPSRKSIRKERITDPPPVRLDLQEPLGFLAGIAEYLHASPCREKGGAVPSLIANASVALNPCF
jgi:hypothetical protein